MEYLRRRDRGRLVGRRAGRCLTGGKLLVLTAVAVGSAPGEFPPDEE